MRKQFGKSILASVAFVTVGLGAASFASAATATYTIDPLQSTLTLLGNLTGNSASQQTSGSLSTSFSGTIVAEKNGSNILFPGRSLLDAALQPSNQQPRNDGTPGSQPADYGRTAPGPFGSTTLEALRGIQLDLFDDTSGLGATIAGNGTFPSTSFGVEFDNGESDSIFGNTSNPDIDLTGKGTANSNGNGSSSVVLNGAIETLTLKFSTGEIGYSIAGTGDSSARFVGTIVATRLVPEPSAAGAVGLVGATLVARRRRRRSV